ncbi:hypothetical protein [Rubrivirga sp.]|uniref:hypothetical protein n=1 Tax=Rubrivirga sp. TaxID=1885344 RepID=UPI003C78DE83
MSDLDTLDRLLGPGLTRDVERFAVLFAREADGIGDPLTDPERGEYDNLLRSLGIGLMVIRQQCLARGSREARS